jgi:zinc D-Ala-D-Ala dipeptidase
MRRAAALVLALGCGGTDARPVAPEPDEPVAPTSAPASEPRTEPTAAPPSSVQAEPRAPPPGFTDLRELLPPPLLRIGYATADNFTGAPLPGYGAPGAWLRDDAARALAEAARALAEQQLRLVVFDAYRPRRASAAMVAWTRAQGRGDLLEDGYIAPRSQHNRGVAIDVGLCDADGSLLDMGSAWDHFGAESRLGAARGVAALHRAVLHRAMRAAGFHPYTAEWWHFGFPATDTAEQDVPYGVDEAL